jgi:hypothetical protein
MSDESSAARIERLVAEEEDLRSYPRSPNRPYFPYAGIFPRALKIWTHLARRLLSRWYHAFMWQRVIAAVFSNQVVCFRSRNHAREAYAVSYTN